MFLKLLAEHKNIRSDTFNFLDYWTSVPTLTLKESMRSLNARRVNIKHKGLLPSKEDILISRVNTTDFFTQNTLTEFAVDFNNISIFSLIVYENVRDYLEKAQKSLHESKVDDCLEHCAFAFDELVSGYENSKKERWGDSSPFFFGRDLTFLSAFHMDLGRDRGSQKLGEFIDKVKGSLEGIQKAVKIMSFGIDYKKYVKFQILTPIIVKTIGRNQIGRLNPRRKLTKGNCQYCIDFVLESSLKLQEFDFDFEEVLEKKSYAGIIPKYEEK